MPVLSNAIESKEVILPVTKGRIMIKSAPTYADSGAIVEAMKDEKKDGTFVLFDRCIVTWDFTDEEGTLLERNEENYAKLPMRDVNFLTSEITKTIRMTEDEGKNSPQV